MADGIEHAHEHYVLDIAYDFYGERMATCSQDKCIKVWEREHDGGGGGAATGSAGGAGGSAAGGGGRWRKTGETKLDFVPRRVTWAHPEYGQIIACCGEYRVLVLEELVGAGRVGSMGDSGMASGLASGGAGGASGGGSSRADGDKGNDSSSSSSSSASSSRWKKKADLLESREEVLDVEFAPRQYGLKLAAAASDGYVRIYEAVDIVEGDWSVQAKFRAVEDNTNGPGEVFAVSWRKLAFATERLVVGTSKGAQVWEYNGEKQMWLKVMNLNRQDASAASVESAAVMDTDDRSRGQVQDVAWAPNMGRIHDVVAVAYEDVIDIYKLPISGDGAPEVYCDVQRNIMSRVELGKIWRLEWNITGTTLASSSEKGVCLWYQSNESEWTGDLTR